MGRKGGEVDWMTTWEQQYEVLRRMVQAIYERGVADGRELEHEELIRAFRLARRGRGDRGELPEREDETRRRESDE